MFRSLLRVLKNMFGALGMFGLCLYYIVMIGLLIGYFINIYKVIQIALSNGLDTDITVLFIVRIVGIFIGILGGVVGWI